MTQIFLDESGYTGQDLLNFNQPVFSLASINYPEETCQKLKAKFFGGVRASELTHSSISRRPSQQRMAIDFLEHLKNNMDAVKICVAHKRYVLVTKMVDIIVESAAHENGINLFKQGVNIALANVLYYAIPAFGGNEFFEAILFRFQRMVRFPSRKTFNDFFRPLLKMHESEDMEKLLTFFRYSYYRLGYELLDIISKDSLDIAMTCALNLMGMWRAEIKGPLTVMHDISSNMAKQRQIWDALVDPNLPSKVVGYDTRKMVFPIAIQKTDFDDSKNWAGLQLVDVIAGAVVRCVKWIIQNKEENDIYGKSVTNIVQNYPAFTILPEAKVTPEELGTIGEDVDDPIKYVANIISKHMK